MVDDYLGKWQVWHARREERLTSPHGFLAITGLHWLGDQPQRFDDVPGAWAATPDGVEVRLAEGEELEIDGAPVTGRHVFDGVDRPGLRARFGEAVVEIAVRGGTPILRPRHPANPRRLDHVPTPTYAPSKAWLVPATFRPYDAPADVRVDTVIDGLVEDVEAVGEVEFEIAGTPQRMVAFAEDPGGALWLVFADGTSGDTTYSFRQLVTDPPAADGSMILDFNRATNLPCAYTEFSICPVPPAENRLAVRIEAGEKLPVA